MKISGSTILLVVITIIITSLIVVPAIVLSRAKPHTREDAVVNPGPWTNLGTVSNGIRSGLVMRRTDPDTGAMIYVLIGTELGGIYVLPAEKSK